MRRGIHRCSLLTTLIDKRQTTMSYLSLRIATYKNGRKCFAINGPGTKENKERIKGIEKDNVKWRSDMKKSWVIRLSKRNYEAIIDTFPDINNLVTDEDFEDAIKINGGSSGSSSSSAGCLWPGYPGTRG